MKKYIVPLAIAAAFAAPGLAHADGPTVNANATCAGFTIHAEGLTPADSLIVEQGSNAPARPIVSAAGTIDLVMPSALNGFYTADVVLNGATVYHQMVDCDGTAPAVDPTGIVAVKSAPRAEVKVVPVERPRRVAERLLRFGFR
ncbi:MAG TPA: hypothetical protein VHQ23_03965 [Ilumatobacteraceae bacterium]|jgi:hypothetical protein|nr:hypothetical protein [Ilumatobacteraceae bacterium]